MPWRHMGEWRYSYAFIDLVTRWRWVLSFTLLPLYPKGKSSRFPLGRRLGGNQSRSGLCGIKRNLLPLSGIEPLPSSPSLYWLSYPDSFLILRPIVITSPRTIFRTSRLLSSGLIVVTLIPEALELNIGCDTDSSVPPGKPLGDTTHRTRPLPSKPLFIISYNLYS
jgi:hypothetical protein